MLVISEFQDSLVRDPQNPVIQYHLGMALYKNEQFKQAREVLEKALSISKNFKGSDEARNTLDDIRKKLGIS